MNLVERGQLALKKGLDQVVNTAQLAYGTARRVTISKSMYARCIVWPWAN